MLDATLQPARGGRGATRTRPPRGLLALGVLVSIGTLIPLGFVVVMTVAAGWDTVVRLVFRPRIGELLVNTVGLVLIAVPLCILVGVAAAWLVERTSIPGARVWVLVLAAPLAVPAFVNSYAWVSTIPSLRGLPAGVLISVLSYFPLVYIPSAAVLRRLDPALEQSAASLGLGPWRVFLRVVLPQLRLAITGGALLVGLHLLAEFGAFALINFSTFTTAIMEQYQATFNGAAANMLASVLVLLCLLLLVAENSARGRASYARLGSGVASRPRIWELGRYRFAALAGVVVLAVLSVGVPVGNVARWLVVGGPEAWDGARLGVSLLQTLGYGLLGALVTCVLAFPVALLVVRHAGRLSRLLESVNYVASALPGIVIALALVTVTIAWARPLYQTAAVVIAAYVLLFMPRALVTLRSGLAQVPRGLDEAARALGVPPFVAFLRVTMRMSAPAVAAAAALVFLGIVNELTATLVLAPSGVRTLATSFWSLSSELDFAAAAPYALVMILISMPMTHLFYRQSQKAVGL